MKVDYWVNNFNSFKPEQQLKIAEAIKDELKFDELIIEDDTYDISKSEQVRSFFEGLVETANKKEDLKKLKDILERFNNLSLKYRIEALYKIAEIIDYSNKKQEQEIGADICQKEGHDFGEWKSHSYTTYGPVMYPDHQVGEGLTKHTFYRRVCTRCGYKEEELFIPEEVRNKKNR